MLSNAVTLLCMNRPLNVPLSQCVPSTLPTLEQVQVTNLKPQMWFPPLTLLKVMVGWNCHWDFPACLGQREGSRETRIWIKDCCSSQSPSPICNLDNIQQQHKQSHATSRGFYLLRESLASVCLSKASLTCKAALGLGDGCICASSLTKCLPHPPLGWSWALNSSQVSGALIISFWRAKQSTTSR